jgi:hypothetical protein
MPAAFTAAITLLISSALARSAPLASAAWLTTPVDKVATSGTRVALASAETDSRVPSPAGAVTCADAFMAELRARRVTSEETISGRRGRDVRSMKFSVLTRAVARRRE